jgi:Tfp pilus assembly protein PilV
MIETTVKSKPAGSPAAFTLIEVMVAVLFVAIILPVAMKAITTSVSVVSAAKNSRQAAMLAEYKMAEILLEQTWTSGAESGDFGSDYPAFTWASALESRAADGMSDLSVSVYWQQKGYDRSVTITTLVYNEQ